MAEIHATCGFCDQLSPAHHQFVGLALQFSASRLSSRFLVIKELMFLSYLKALQPWFICSQLLWQPAHEMNLPHIFWCLGTLWLFNFNWIMIGSIIWNWFRKSSTTTQTSRFPPLRLVARFFYRRRWWRSGPGSSWAAVRESNNSTRSFTMRQRKPI